MLKNQQSPWHLEYGDQKKGRPGEWRKEGGRKGGGEQGREERREVGGREGENRPFCTYRASVS